ncbi:FliH/SctL family protein [Microbacterium sp. NPDC090007]|uniref:FliH/SctL family protein n=1 Tax=Microbacterium sp. NPDC090007 TaxID=3364204 RepID=UPI003827FFA4
MTDSAFAPLVPPRIGDAAADPRAAAERARARGYADGFARGSREARDERDRLLQQAREDADRDAAGQREAVRTALAALQHARARWDEAVAGLVRTDAERVERAAIELAEVILGAELSDAARSAAHALRRAAAAAPGGEDVRVLLHPRDARIVVDAPSASGIAGFEIAASDEVDPGGALVELREGRIDARIDAALDRARAALDDDEDGPA